MKRITIPSKIEFMDEVLSFVNAELDLYKCSKKIKSRINIALDEFFTNISCYAYSGIGDVTIGIEIGGEPVAAVIELIDSGKRYNPLDKDDPDTTLAAEDRDAGGLGVFIAKELMDSLSYKYENGHNILSIKKYLT